MSGGLVAAGGDTEDSRCQGSKRAFQGVTVEPAHVTRLQWISGEDGKLSEAVRLGEVRVMPTGSGWLVCGAGEVAW